MPSPQKQKGSSWERVCAIKLTDLYGETFIRVPGSGAYVGGVNAARKEFLHEGVIRVMKGDIVPPPHFKKFNAECKSYADFPFHQLYTGDCKTLDGWLLQALDAADEGDFTVLFMKFNRKGTFIVFNRDHLKSFNLGNHTAYTSTVTGSWIIADLETFFTEPSNVEAFKSLSQGL